MVRTDIIQHLININEYRSYLEIGISDPYANHNRIKCRYKIGVDPNGLTSFTGTSDEFFEVNRTMFDIVFVDGLHTDDQVMKDIINSIRWLSTNGTIVIHDCLPDIEGYQIDDQETALALYGAWTGPVWKAIAKLRMTRPDLTLSIVDTDCGCGILQLNPSELYTQGIGQELNYEFFVQHKHSMFDIITPEQFYLRYK